MNKSVCYFFCFLVVCIRIFLPYFASTPVAIWSVSKQSALHFSFNSVTIGMPTQRFSFAWKWKLLPLAAGKWKQNKYTFFGVRTGTASVALVQTDWLLIIMDVDWQWKVKHCIMYATIGCWYTWNGWERSEKSNNAHFYLFDFVVRFKMFSLPWTVIRASRVFISLLDLTVSPQLSRWSLWFIFFFDKVFEQNSLLKYNNFVSDWCHAWINFLNTEKNKT